MSIEGNLRDMKQAMAGLSEAIELLEDTVKDAILDDLRAVEREWAYIEDDIKQMRDTLEEADLEEP